MRLVTLGLTARSTPLSAASKSRFEGVPWMLYRACNAASRSRLERFVAHTASGMTTWRPSSPLIRASAMCPAPIIPITSCDTKPPPTKHKAPPPQGRKGFRGTTLILAVAQHDERCERPALWPDYGGRRSTSALSLTFSSATACRSPLRGWDRNLLRTTFHSVGDALFCRRSSYSPRRRGVPDTIACVPDTCNAAI